MRLARYFRFHGKAAGDAARLDLRVDLAIPGLPAPLTFERSAIATIEPQHFAGYMTPQYLIQWAPETPGSLPVFRGELTVKGTEDYDSFELELRGDYEPPFGIVGKGFDLAAGHGVAQQTARNLLASIKDFVEREFRTDESKKKSARALVSAASR